MPHAFDLPTLPPCSSQHFDHGALIAASARSRLTRAFLLGSTNVVLWSFTGWGTGSRTLRHHVPVDVPVGIRQREPPLPPWSLSTCPCGGTHCLHRDEDTPRTCHSSPLADPRSRWPGPSWRVVQHSQAVYSIVDSCVEDGRRNRRPRPAGETTTTRR